MMTSSTEAYKSLIARHFPAIFDDEMLERKIHVTLPPRSFLISLKGLIIQAETGNRSVDQAHGIEPL